MVFSYFCTHFGAKVTNVSYSEDEYFMVQGSRLLMTIMNLKLKRVELTNGGVIINKIESVLIWTMLNE